MGFLDSEIKKLSIYVLFSTDSCQLAEIFTDFSYLKDTAQSLCKMPSCSILSNFWYMVGFHLLIKSVHGTNLVRPVLHPPGGPRVRQLQAQKGQKSMLSNFHQTKAKLLPLIL